MRRSLTGAFEVLLSRWVDFARKYRLLIVLTIFAGAFFCLRYTIDNISMNTDTRDMLSPKLEWRNFALQVDEKFPQYNDLILVVVEAGTADEASDAGSILYEQLLLEDKFFKSVYYPSGLPFFKQSAFLYLDTTELQDLADNLAAVQPFLARLTEDQSLRGLFTMMAEAIEAKLDGDEIDIEPLLKDINSALLAIKNNEHYRLSWQRLMGGLDEDRSVYREFIVLQPNLDYGGAFPARDSIDRIHRLADEYQLNQQNHINVRLTGNVTMSYEEMISVSRGMEISVIIALCLVAVVLVVGLRSVWMVLATLVTLVNGLIYTAGFATATVGELNLISVAFAVLYIGLGVDFAIHYCLRYREHMLRGENNLEAMENTAVDLGKALALCALTTAIGFYAFIPTDYVGVAELGWISGSSMFISFFITLTLIPALLSYHPQINADERLRNGKFIRYLYHFPATHAGTILIITGLLTLASLFFVSRLNFDDNTLNLQPRKNPSVITFVDLLDDKDSSPWTAVTLANSSQEAKAIEKQLQDKKIVDKVVWLDDFIPEDQEVKLAIITEIELLLGYMIMDSISEPPTVEENLQSMITLRDKLHEFVESGNTDPVYASLHDNLEKFISATRLQTNATKSALLAQLKHSLLASLPGRLGALTEALEAKPVNLSSLPEALKSRWLHNGEYRIEIYPEENLSDNDHLRQFVEVLDSELDNVSGPPITSIKASDAVVKAFKQAFLYSLAAIVLVLLILLQRKTDTLFIMVPLLLAALFTAAVSVLINMPLNFANIIALPLILGIGVDSSIHIVRRLRAMPSGGNRRREVLANSASRAVWVSALTSILSIGNLAFSNHPGTASMGLLLTIGIGMTLLCSLIVLPALLSIKLKTH